MNINFILNAIDSQALSVLMDVPDKHSGYTHIALEVNELESLGCSITEGPIVTPDRASFIFIRDPDSNVIEFHKPAGT